MKLVVVVGVRDGLDRDSSICCSVESPASACFFKAFVPSSICSPVALGDLDVNLKYLTLCLFCPSYVEITANNILLVLQVIGALGLVHFVLLVCLLIILSH